VRLTTRYEDWNKLSNCITEQLIQKLDPQTKKISSAASSTSLEEERGIIEQLSTFQLKNTQARKQKTQQAQQQTETKTQTQETPQQTQEKPQQKQEKVHPNLADFCPKFTYIPRRVTEKGASLQEITQQNLDKSSLLTKILAASYPQGTVSGRFIRFSSVSLSFSFSFSFSFSLSVSFSLWFSL
jgi:DNA primase